MKLCINNRDELHVVELNDVAFMKASGNFTEFHLADGSVRTLLPCLSDYEHHVRRLYGEADCPFFRAGRSLLVNTDAVQSIILQKQMVVFRFPQVHLSDISKSQLRRLKDFLSARF